MEQGVVDGPVVLVIKAPDQKYDDQTISCFLSWTVEKLKSHLSVVYPSRPRFKDQRLVYSGKLLQDHCKLRDILRQQDEFHMLHLVCAARSPPSSPETLRRNSSAGSAERNASTGPVPPGSPAAGSDGIGQNPNQRSAQGSDWAQYLEQHRLNSRMPHYPMYNPLTLLWWQQLYVWQCHINHQTWLASVRSSQQLAPPPADPSRQRRDVAPEHPQNARLAQGQNEEDLNRDWLDWVYAAARGAVLLALVYFYSSFSRFVMVTGAMLLLYLHQAGWLPFNLENEQQDVAEAANREEPHADNHNNLQDMAQQADEGEEDDGGGVDHEDWLNMGFLSSAWSFITTFFTSLIPELAPNAAN